MAHSAETSTEEEARFAYDRLAEQIPGLPARLLPDLAGLLITVAPVQQVLWVDAATFLVSAGTLALIGTSFNAPRDQEERRAIRQDIVDGLRYVLGHPVLRNISAMMALINLVGATVYAQLVVFAKRQLDASDSQVALLYAAGSAGVVLLSLAAGPVRRRLSFSVAALGALTACFILALDLVMPAWLAALIVAVVYGIIAFVLVKQGQARLKQAAPPVPERTVETVKEDVEWAKTQMRSDRT